MSDLDRRELALLDQTKGLPFEVIQQPRTNFELEHFVIGEKHMPGKRWAQAVLELQVRMFSIERGRINKERLLVELDILKGKLEAEQDEHQARLIQLDIDEKQVDLAEFELARLGAIREAETLMALLQKMPAYTREQLEAEEPEYWRRRLTEQILLDGNRQAIRMMLEADVPALPEEVLTALAVIQPEKQLGSGK